MEQKSPLGTQLIITLLLFATTFTSCKEKAHLRIQSKVHGVTLKSISWKDYNLSDHLRPGETSDKIVIKDHKEAWPKKGQVEFYMTGNGNTVYLKTKATYELDADDDLLIVISDTTSVYNPMFE